MTKDQDMLPGMSPPQPTPADYEKLCFTGKIIPPARSRAIHFEYLDNSATPHQIWLPLSQIAISNKIETQNNLISINPDEKIITMPRWLAKEKGLI